MQFATHKSHFRNVTSDLKVFGEQGVFLFDVLMVLIFVVIRFSLKNDIVSMVFWKAIYAC